MGISQGTVSGWEHDKSDPPLDFLIDYAAEKGVSLGWLLTADPAGKVYERGAAYGIGPDVARLAQELQAHPLLLGAVKKMLAADDKLSRAAKEMASVWGISEVDAYLRLLAARKETA